MLTVRLTDCVGCTTIPVLLQDIDCKLSKLASKLYNNTIFAVNSFVDGETMSSLLHYKRILTYKYCNSEYAEHYTIANIASRVKLLKYK